MFSLLKWWHVKPCAKQIQAQCRRLFSLEKKKFIPKPTIPSLLKTCLKNDRCLLWLMYDLKVIIFRFNMVIFYLSFYKCYIDTHGGQSQEKGKKNEISMTRSWTWGEKSTLFYKNILTPHVLIWQYVIQHQDYCFILFYLNHAWMCSVLIF